MNFVSTSRAQGLIKGHEKVVRKMVSPKRFDEIEIEIVPSVEDSHLAEHQIKPPTIGEEELNFDVVVVAEVLAISDKSKSYEMELQQVRNGEPVVSQKRQNKGTEKAKRKQKESRRKIPVIEQKEAARLRSPAPFARQSVPKQKLERPRPLEVSDFDPTERLRKNMEQALAAKQKKMKGYSPAHRAASPVSATSSFSSGETPSEGSSGASTLASSTGLSTALSVRISLACSPAAATAAVFRRQGTTAVLAPPEHPSDEKPGSSKASSWLPSFESSWRATPIPLSVDDGWSPIQKRSSPADPAAFVVYVTSSHDRERQRTLQRRGCLFLELQELEEDVQLLKQDIKETAGGFLTCGAKSPPLSPPARGLYTN
jgi:hypothetical protein